MINVDKELDRLRRNAYQYPLTRAMAAAPNEYFAKIDFRTSIGLTLNA